MHIYIYIFIFLLQKLNSHIMTPVQHVSTACNVLHTYEESFNKIYANRAYLAQTCWETKSCTIPGRDSDTTPKILSCST